MRVLSADNKLPIVRKMKPGYTKFNMSHSHKLSGNMGYLIPIMVLPVMPGDRVNIGVEAVMRFMPMVAAPLHEVWATFDYYSVPYRILDDTFVDFITGGEDGLDTTACPRWTPTGVGKTVEGSLWDHLGFPTNVIPSLKPVDWPRRAYNRIYNWHYRDINLQTEVDEDANEDLLLNNWPSDYFRQGLPWQQRGIAPALPISGITSAQWAAAINQNIYPLAYVGSSNERVKNVNSGTTQAQIKMSAGGTFSSENFLVAQATPAQLNGNTVDLSSATTFDIADLREALQIQRFMEINARTGARFNEFLQGQFNISPVDKTLQQPEFIGRMRMPIMIDEVLQTSRTESTGTETPQGNIAGKGIGVGSDYVGSVRIEEPGLIMGLMCVMPRPAYQQGIHRPWLIQNKYDFPFPVFANLSEQIVKVGELYVDGTNDDADWAYVGRYDEYRVMHDSVHGLLKKVSGGFAHWHMGRIFSSQPGNNSTFIQADCSAIKARIMAVTDEDTFIVNVGNKVDCTRALPLFANPSVMEGI